MAKQRDRTPKGTMRVEGRYDSTGAVRGNYGPMQYPAGSQGYAIQQGNAQTRQAQQRRDRENEARAQRFDAAFGTKKPQTRGQITSTRNSGGGTAVRVTAVNGKNTNTTGVKVTATKKAAPQRAKNTGGTSVGVVAVKKTKKKGR